MFFRHTAVLWKFEGLGAGQTASPLMRHVNPNFDDRQQEFVCLFELSNSQADGALTCWLELGAEGIFIPTEKASPGDDVNGDPLPFTGLGPFQGGIPLWPDGDDGGPEGPDGPIGLTFSLVPPLIRVKVDVIDGVQANTASGRLVLISNGPIALRPENP